MTIAGIDLGLTHTGWAIEHNDGRVTSGTIHAAPKYTKAKNRRRRLLWWGAQLQQLLMSNQVNAVYVEAPIIHSRNARGMIEVTKLHGVLDLAAGPMIEVTPVPNQTLKSWVNQHGVGYVTWPLDKDDMLTFARTHYGLDCGDTEYDRADAFLVLMSVLYPNPGGPNG